MHQKEQYKRDLPKRKKRDPHNDPQERLTQDDYKRDLQMKPTESPAPHPHPPECGWP